MANYYGQFRSNYFKVKDEEKFLDWCESAGVDSWENTEGLYAISSGNHDDSGAVPSFRSLPADYDNDTPPEGWTQEEFDDAYQEFDFFQELSQHLAEGEIAAVIETGAEKLRYLVGYAVAINHLGDQVEVGLNQIYDKAEAKFGKRPGLAEY